MAAMAPDTILGELGTDYMFGGAGADRFIISHDGPGSSEVPDIIFDADADDRAILDGLTLTGGVRNLYNLEIDEFENEYWVPNEELRWLIGEDDGSIDFRLEDGDLTVNIFNDGGEYFERFVIKDWQQGDLGLQLVDVDNRYPLGGNLMAGSGDGPALAMADLFSSGDDFRGEDAPLGARQFHRAANPELEASGPAYRADDGAHADQTLLLAAG